MNLPEAVPAAGVAAELQLDLSGLYGDDAEPQACWEAPSADALEDTVIRSQAAGYGPVGLLPV